MGELTYLLRDNTTRTVPFADGDSVMATATEHDIPGIIGECGGEMSCATCHVYVDEAWFDRVGKPGRDEADMLEAVEEVGTTSRLSCQIQLRPELDGLRVTVGINL